MSRLARRKSIGHRTSGSLGVPRAVDGQPLSIDAAMRRFWQRRRQQELELLGDEAFSLRATRPCL